MEISVGLFIMIVVWVAVALITLLAYMIRRETRPLRRIRRAKRRNGVDLERGPDNQEDRDEQPQPPCEADYFGDDERETDSNPSRSPPAPQGRMQKFRTYWQRF
ncbi:hypothetical protein F4821DRAFT_261086 [Hypoxylon rubiginosum]|uniref:Uncharacterized protein n=1 Tax=Hypoxylon rubiginosum TaxID=110542 RepID=A0ACC0CXQ7_9PEZI|nr:hypothetical protein F4821DRAFT_261086 [Hypoxylon rubiginosum]